MSPKNLVKEAKTEDILKVMETLGGVALKLKLEEKMSGPFGFRRETDWDLFGFNKKKDEDSDEEN